MAILEETAELPAASFGRGEVVIAAGTRPGRLFFLASGRVEVVREGTRIAVVGTPGSVLGELSLLLGVDTTADVVALEETRVHVAEDPFGFLRAHPEAAIQVARMLAHRLDAASRYLVDVREQLKGCSDHVGMVDGVLEAILHRDLKRKVGGG